MARRPPAPPAHGTHTLAIGGLPYFGRRLANLLAGDGWRTAYLETRGWRAQPALTALRIARASDLNYQIGGQIERFSRPHLLRSVVRRPMVMHWAGSDVLYARRALRAGRATPALQRGITHWAGAPWLADELRKAGVAARWLPHSWVEPAQTLPPLPAGQGAPFTVLTYLPPGREAFYGGEATLQIARALPDVEVLVAGVEHLPWPAPPNVRCLGWHAQMEPLYARAHVLLRLPRHDGLSFMVQEALALGRHVIWNYPFTGVIQAGPGAVATAALRRLAARHAAGCLGLNEAGATFVRERFNRERIRADLQTALAEEIRR